MKMNANITFNVTSDNLTVTRVTNSSPVDGYGLLVGAGHEVVGFAPGHQGTAFLVGRLLADVHSRGAARTTQVDRFRRFALLVGMRRHGNHVHTECLSWCREKRDNSLTLF